MKERFLRCITRVKRLWGRVPEARKPIDYITEGGPILRGVALLVFMSLVAVLWRVSSQFTSFTSNQISLFASLTNILLTLVLLWLYLSIASSERAQTKLEEDQLELQSDIESLQSTQTDIMGAEFQPVIEVVGFETGLVPFEESPSPISRENTEVGDIVKITISNPSSAVATNLQLQTIVDYLGPQRPIFGMNSPLTQVDREETWTEKPGGVLRGEQSAVEFATSAKLGVWGTRTRNAVEFSDLFPQLFDNSDLHFVRIGISLVYEDRTRDEHTIAIEGLEISSSDLPEDESATLDYVREHADEVPFDAVHDGLLFDGVTEIPPEYRRS